MTDPETALSRTLTHEELDRAVSSLRNVGGLYELLADVVEEDNRKWCYSPGELTGERDTPCT